MVLGTGLAVATAMTGGVAAVAGSQVGAIVGAATGCAETAAAASAAASAAAAAASGGAVAGAAATGTATGTILGTISGMATAVGSHASAAGIGTAIAGSGPVGWIALGASETGNQLTLDCWKPVIRDTSEVPSSGMLIKDIVRHPNVANVTSVTKDDGSLPNIVLENVWQEKFELEYFVIQSSGRLVAHAKQIAV